MKMTTTNYWVYMMDQMMMDSKRQAKRKLGHAKSRAIGSSSRDVNLRLPFAGGWVGDLKSKRKVETEQLTQHEVCLPCFLFSIRFSSAGK